MIIFDEFADNYSILRFKLLEAKGDEVPTDEEVPPVAEPEEEPEVKEEEVKEEEVKEEDPPEETEPEEANPATETEEPTDDTIDTASEADKLLDLLYYKKALEYSAKLKNEVNEAIDKFKTLIALDEKARNSNDTKLADIKAEVDNTIFQLSIFINRFGSIEPKLKKAFIQATEKSMEKTLETLDSLYEKNAKGDS